MIDHSKCDHPSTPAARSKCRKLQASGEAPAKTQRRPSTKITTRVEPRLLDMTNATPPAPRVRRDLDDVRTPEQRQSAFMQKLWQPEREADERNKRRIQREEDIAAGRAKPFYGRRKQTSDRPTMWWLDDKEK